jgi:hypothetical protein
METACDPTDGECADFLAATADNDTDTYLDEDCGGDDCDDENAAVHPGAVELCDAVDDDCDGLTDLASIAGPLELDSASAIGPAGLAAGGGLAAVVWQRGVYGAGAVLAAVVGSDGATIDDALDFTASGGTGAVGRAPDVAAGGTAGAFWVVWVADGPSTNPVATVMDLAADDVAGTVTAGTATALGSGTATAVASPQIAWDGAGSGWVAGFAAAYGGSNAIELQAQNMHSSPAGSFPVSSATDAIDGLSLAVIGTDGYAVAWAREDASSDGDLEVFASEIELAADAWSNAAGFPLRISPADVVALDVDNSFWPSLAATGGGAWVAAFVDTDPGTVVESVPSDIALYDDGALSDLVGTGTYFYREPALAYDGARFGLLYLSRLGTFESLDFRSLDAAFAAPAAPYAGSRIDFSSGADNTSGARLVAVAADRFAAVWISRTDEVDHLVYLDFEVCGAGD